MAAPTKYKEEFKEQVKKLCKLGATDIEIADFFNVSEKTINNWKKEYPEFLQSIREGKEHHDNERAESALLSRALGYSHDDVHITSYQGEITETPIVKHYPPDTKALEMWLTNRNPERWKKIVQNDHAGEVKVRVIRKSKKKD